MRSAHEYCMITHVTQAVNVKLLLIQQTSHLTKGKGHIYHMEANAARMVGHTASKLSASDYACRTHLQ